MWRGLEDTKHYRCIIYGLDVNLYPSSDMTQVPASMWYNLEMWIHMLALGSENSLKVDIFGQARTKEQRQWYT